MNRPRLVATLALACWLAKAGAEGPSLDYLYPAGGRQGTGFKVVTGGRLEPWPIKVWTDDDGLVFQPGETRGEYRVEIAATAATGPHLVRGYNAEGASAPRIFVVGDCPEVTLGAATEEPRKASALAEFPVTLNGRMRAAGQVDTFSLDLPGPRLLRARLLAVGLDSPLQATLALLDKSSNRLAAAEPPPGRDFGLTNLIPAAGVYLLQVAAAASGSNANSASSVSDAAVYRLTVQAETVGPANAQALDVLDENSPNVIAWQRQTVVRTLEIPGLSHGVVTRFRPQMCFGFTARPQERYHFVVHAASIGSPLLPVLQVLDFARNPLMQAAPATDPELTWTAPSDGTYLVAVSDAQGRGSPLYSFQLEAASLAPSFRVLAAADDIRVAAGETRALTLKVLRPDTSQAILYLTPVGLPEGLQAPPVTAVPSITTVQLSFQAAPDAKPASQPLRIQIMDPGAVPPQLESAKALLVGKYAPPGALLINETDQLWLTVLTNSVPHKVP